MWRSYQTYYLCFANKDRKSCMVGSFFYSLCNFSYIQLERSCICSSLGTNVLHSISLIPQTRDSNVTRKTTEFLWNKQDRSQWHFWTTLLFCIAPRVRPEPGFGIGNQNQGPILVSLLELKLVLPKHWFFFRFFSRFLNLSLFFEIKVSKA